MDEEATPSTPGYHPPVSAASVAWDRHLDELSTKTGVKQARDRAQYTRQQKGHSLILHLLLGGIVLWIPAIIISASPNHYWHA